VATCLVVVSNSAVEAAGNTINFVTELDRTPKQDDNSIAVRVCGGSEQLVEGMYISDISIE
jgi:hypothetical protein